MTPKNTDRLYYSLWGVIALFLLLNPAAHAESLEQPDGTGPTIGNMVYLASSGEEAETGVYMYLAGAAMTDLHYRLRTIRNLAEEVGETDEMRAELAAMFVADAIECTYRSGPELLELMRIYLRKYPADSATYAAQWVVQFNEASCSGD